MITMLDSKKMTVEEIKNYLHIDCGVPFATLNNIKGKKNLVNFMNSLDQVDGITQTEIVFKEIDDNIEPIVENIDMTKEQDIPTMNSPEWSNYVLSQLTEDEKDQGYPKTDGLRRLVEKLIGKIIAIESDVIQGPGPGNGYTATVKTKIFIETEPSYSSNRGSIPGKQIIFSACADASKEYCPSPFDQHLSAIAETRAEGRAYRKILRLKNTATREEMVSKSPEDNGELITKSQKNMIDVLCRNDRLNINVKKIFNMLCGDKSINKYSFNEAATIAQKLSEFQSNESLISEDIRGYDPNWRD